MVKSYEGNMKQRDVIGQRAEADDPDGSPTIRASAALAAATATAATCRCRKEQSNHVQPAAAAAAAAARECDAMQSLFALLPDLALAVVAQGAARSQCGSDGQPNCWIRSSFKQLATRSTRSLVQLLSPIRGENLLKRQGEDGLLNNPSFRLGRELGANGKEDEHERLRETGREVGFFVYSQLRFAKSRIAWTD